MVGERFMLKFSSRTIKGDMANIVRSSLDDFSKSGMVLSCMETSLQFRRY
jgi:hypothetical protein